MIAPQPSGTMAQGGPLIVTALLGAADFAWADALRRRLFPPGANRVPAHITLLHHLPPARADEVRRRIAEECRAPPPSARLTRIMDMGTGTGFAVESPDLLTIRDRLADAFFRDLVPVDQVPARLHITVQNHVARRAARQTQAEQVALFRPRQLAIAGLALWRYHDGGWSGAGQARFRG